MTGFSDTYTLEVFSKKEEVHYEIRKGKDN